MTHDTSVSARHKRDAHTDDDTRDRVNAHLTEQGIGTDLPLLLRPEEVAHALSIGRTTVFALIFSGELESVVVGQRARRIPRDAVRSYVARLRSQG